MGFAEHAGGDRINAGTESWGAGMRDDLVDVAFVRMLRRGKMGGQVMAPPSRGGFTRYTVTNRMNIGDYDFGPVTLPVTTGYGAVTFRV